MKKILICVITIFVCIFCITNVNASSITVNDSISMDKIVTEFNALEEGASISFNNTTNAYELKKNEGGEVISYIKLKYEDITAAQDSTHPALVERKSIKYNLCTAVDETDTDNTCASVTEEQAQNSTNYAKLLLKAVFAANGGANIESDTWDKIIAYYKSQGKYKVKTTTNINTEFVYEFEIPLIGWETDFALIQAKSNLTGNDIEAFNQLKPTLAEKSHTDNSVTLNPSADTSNIPNYESRCYIYRSETENGPFIKLNGIKYNCSGTEDALDEDLDKSYYYKSSLVGSPYLSEETVVFSYQGPSDNGSSQISSQENTKNPQTGVSSPVLLIATALTLSIIGYFCFKNKDALANFD